MTAPAHGVGSFSMPLARAAGGVSYRDRVDLCREAVADFLEALWAETGGIRGVTWKRDADPNAVMLRIAALAKVLARLRGTISIWREGSRDDESYNFSTPQIEGPQRAMSLLYALARGHALVHGRRQLAAADLPIVARAALESTPTDRRAVMRILLANDGIATTAHVQKQLRCSAPTARAILETLDKLAMGELENSGPPEPATLTLDSAFRWLLSALKENGRREGEGIKTKPTPCSDDIDFGSEDDDIDFGSDDDVEELSPPHGHRALNDEEITRLGTMPLDELVREFGES